MRKGKEPSVNRNLGSQTFHYIAYALLLFSASLGGGASAREQPRDLWAHDRLVPWVVGVYDTTPLGPEERAEMLQKLGFKKFAYFWEPNTRNIRLVDAEIEALQHHGIDIVAWWFSYSAQDPFAALLLEAFRRHHISPSLWISPTYRDLEGAWKRYVPERLARLPPSADFKRLSNSDQAIIAAANNKAWQEYTVNAIAPTTGEQLRRVRQEADRISAIAHLVAPYGNRIALYNHGGWSGVEDNQLAIIERLKGSGMGGIGMVYAFNHVRDKYHDDTLNFPAVWSKIKPYVVAVALTGVCMDDGSTAYPSQGRGELEMMRTIQDSGWYGQVGVFAGEWHGRGGAETTLRNILIGVDWIRAELRRAGSGGPRPFPAIPLSNQAAE